MNILITGGAGFIGSHTADKLYELGHQIRILDCLKKPIHLKGFPKYLDKTKYEFIYGDVRDKATMVYAMEGIDVVYHLAAYQDYLPDYSTFSHVNTYSTSLIFEIIEEFNYPIKKIIVASSQAVMGEGKYLNQDGDIVFPNLRTDEQLAKMNWNHRDPVTGIDLHMQLSDELVINPQNPYAMSKYQQEMLALNLGKRIGIPTIALRYSIVQGARQSFYNAYSGACRIFSLAYFLNKQPTIYEDGGSIRDYVNIMDVVDANVLVMQKEGADFGVFNVGGGKPYSVSEFAEVVASVFGKEANPKMPSEYRFGDTRHIFSDISKLRNLGWKPNKDAHDSAREYKTYLEQQNDIDDILEYTEKHMKNLGVIRRAKK